MDERKEILQDTIDRLIETALQELDQKLPEAGGEAALSHISDQLRQDAQLDEQHRKLMLDVQRVEVGDSEPSSAPNKDLALNWTGMECIEVLEGLFETSIHLNTLNERMEMFNLAMVLMECQSMTEWIKRTEDEKSTMGMVSC